MSTLSAPFSFSAAVADLRLRISGDVVTPADGAAYDAARAAWNASVRQRPAVIVVPASSSEVAEAVRFARAAGLRVAVQPTGHGVARPADDALLVLTHRLQAVHVDPVARTATVQAGAKWGAVLTPAQAHGLAPLIGSTTDVGAVGYVLGGGLGWLGRRYGLGSDSVRSFDLVTPDGIEVHCDRFEQPEVFWALKGGGAGSLGIVTSMEIDLYPVDTVYAGNLLYPVEMAAEVMTRWRDWVAGVGDELSSSVLVMNFPPFEQVPEPVRGRSFVIVRGCWSGDLAAGQELIDEWREWRQPALDMFGVMPFSMADTISNDPVDPMPAMMTSELFDSLPDEAIAAIVHAAAPAPGQPPILAFAEIRHGGGAVRNRGGAASIDRARSAEFFFNTVAVAAVEHAELAIDAQFRQLRRQLAPFTTGAAYLNFLEGRERQERTAQAFSHGHLNRMRVVKSALDADDRFAHGVQLIEV